MYTLEFVRWVNPRGVDTTGYSTGDYASHAEVDLDAVYKTEAEAQAACEMLATEDPHGVYPEFIAVIALDECKGGIALDEMWDFLETPILYVMEHGGEDAVNVAKAQVRHSHGDLWLYVDDTDGYSLVSEDEVRGWDLATEDDPRIRNEWDHEGNVLRDGERIS